MLEGLRDAASRILTMRRVILALEAIAEGQARQNILIARLVDRFAPDAPVVNAADIQKLTGVSHVNYHEQGQIQDYAERVYRDTGREPTEDEIVRFLEGEDTRL